jgi:hypothetical protein
MKDAIAIRIEQREAELAASAYRAANVEEMLRVSREKLLEARRLGDVADGEENYEAYGAAALAYDEAAVAIGKARRALGGAYVSWSDAVAKWERPDAYDFAPRNPYEKIEAVLEEEREEVNAGRRLYSLLAMF